jgi:hypothetical protein
VAVADVHQRTEQRRIAEGEGPVGLHLPWEASGEAADLLGLVAVLPEHQRRALIDLIRVMAKSR